MSTARTIIAFNSAAASENKIHDDLVASKFGFTGGLVPGVDVFAYLAHAPAERWGERWLTRGAMHARFLKPVYDGEEATVLAEEEADGGLRIALSSRGELCATGRARNIGEAPPPSILPAAPLADRAARPPASPATLAPGVTMGATKEIYTTERGAKHLAATR